MGKERGVKTCRGTISSNNYKSESILPVTTKLKMVSFLDDEMEGARKLSDPAILAVGPCNTSATYRYSREELLKLRKAPSSQKQPDFLDSAYYNNNGIWDPEHWHYNRPTEAGAENGGRNEVDSHKQRRTGDPRERIRKEQDGIVLSPQRRSFNSGCFVPIREPLRPTRPHSPLGGKGESGHIGHRDLNATAPTRRIGSGRILPWDYQDKSDVDNDFGYRRERRDNEERYDRRSFGRDFDIPKDKERHVGRNNNNSNNRYSNRRISGENKEEEPEWFSSGPMSQSDVIELRGFEEIDKPTSKKKSSQKKKQKEQQQNKEHQKLITKEEIKAEDAKKGSSSSINRTSPTPQEDIVNASSKPKSPVSVEQDAAGDGPHIGTNIPNDASFNFEDILKCESIPGIPGLLSNGVESGDAAGSRFSRWFQREKSPPNKQNDSRRSSLQDQDHRHIIKNLLAEQFSEPSVSIPQPGDSESYFAPISPAASSVLPSQQQAKSVNLMEMLQRNNKHSNSQIHSEISQPLKGLDVPGAGKIISLEELEARMMQGSELKRPTEEDSIAFKRLLSQVNNHMSNGPASQKPMSIMEMLSLSQQQDEAARSVSQHRISSSHQHHVNEINYKLQQVQKQAAVQMDLLSKLSLQEIGLQQSRELLNRPEAQAILQGLKRGDITPQHLYQQLANPAMQPRHRELLVTILKMQVTGAMSQNASPVPPPHHLYQQQLRVSPLPQNAIHQRIPSPRELQVHTQNIMQRALIKKKLEEQEENYRKKQAQQRGTSPTKTSSPTPLAFTPTAVLRRMTATVDKDEGSKDKDGKIPIGRPVIGMRPSQIQQNQQQVNPQPQNWSSQFPQQLKQPAGRPIVKANNNYQQSSQTQQEQYFHQQRLLQQQRKNQQTFGANFVNQNQQQPYQQFSHQQLRAQHQNVRSQHQQQQPFGQNQQPQSWTQQMLQGQNFDNRQVGRGDVDGDLSPTSNQLARWFSPDLLNRARQGKLPVIPTSTVAQHALNLEDVERQTTPVGHN